MTTFFIALIFVVAALNEAAGISVPTGKETPITPAKPTPKPVYHHTARDPAPVVEYSEENPEPAPLDPSYVPVQFKYLMTLSGNSIHYIPIRIRNVPVFGASENGEQAPVVAIREIVEFDPTRKQYEAKYLPPVVKPKPYYYSAKQSTVKVPTKKGYPKKASSYAYDKYNYNLKTNQ